MNIDLGLKVSKKNHQMTKSSKNHLMTEQSKKFQISEQVVSFGNLNIFWLFDDSMINGSKSGGFC